MWIEFEEFCGKCAAHQTRYNFGVDVNERWAQSRLGDVGTPCHLCNLPTRITMWKEVKVKDKDEELKIKKSAVLEAAKDCDEFKAIAKKLWPNVLEEEWQDITPTLSLVVSGHNNDYHYIMLDDGEDNYPYLIPEYHIPKNATVFGTMKICVSNEAKAEYKLEQDGYGHLRVMKKK